MSTYKNLAIKIDRLKFTSLNARNCGGKIGDLRKRNDEVLFNIGASIYEEQTKMWNKLQFFQNLQKAITDGKKD